MAMRVCVATVSTPAAASLSRRPSVSKTYIRTAKPGSLPATVGGTGAPHARCSRCCHRLTQCSSSRVSKSAVTRAAKHDEAPSVLSTVPQTPTTVLFAALAVAESVFFTAWPALATDTAAYNPADGSKLFETIAGVLYILLVVWFLGRTISRRVNKFTTEARNPPPLFANTALPSSFLLTRQVPFCQVPSRPLRVICASV
jgi:hypothetical protein